MLEELSKPRCIRHVRALKCLFACDEVGKVLTDKPSDERADAPSQTPTHNLHCDATDGGDANGCAPKYGPWKLSEEAHEVHRAHGAWDRYAVKPNEQKSQKADYSKRRRQHVKRDIDTVLVVLSELSRESGERGTRRRGHNQTRSGVGSMGITCDVARVPADESIFLSRAMAGGGKHGQ